MLFIFLSSCIFLHIHSKLITYTLYHTNDICQYNWHESICLPIFSINQTNQPLSIELNIENSNPCLSQILVYIQSKQCIYCAKNLHDIHCNHSRLRRMIPTNKKSIHQNSIGIIFISLLGIFIIGSLFTLIFIKRSKAHTNLLELINPTNSNQPPAQVPQNIKSTHQNLSQQPTHLTIPKQIKTTTK